MSDFAQLLGSLPPDTNPWTALRQILQAQLSPDARPWVLGVYIFQSVALAIITVMLAIGLLARWRHGTLWFFKKTEMPRGNLLCPHPVNTFSLFTFIFSVFAQAVVWIQYKGIERANAGDPLPFMRCLIWQAYYLPLFFAAWLEMGGSLTGVITSHYRKDRVQSRWVYIPLIHIWIYVLPLLMAVGLGIAFAFLRVRTNELLGMYTVLDNALARREASWTGGLPLASLIAIQPMAVAAQSGSAAFIHELRTVYILVSVWLFLLWAVRTSLREGARSYIGQVWMPSNIFQVSTLMKQIRLLRATRNHEATIGKQEHSQMVSQTVTRHRRSRSSVERQASSLIQMCWTRVASAVALTCVCGYFLWLAIFIAQDPGRLVNDGRRAELFVVAPLLGYIVFCFPIHLAFFLRSFDKTTHPTAMLTNGTVDKTEARSKAGPTMSMLSARRSAGPLEIHVDIDSATHVDVEDEKK